VRDRTFIAIALALMLLLGGAVAVYAYDAARDDLIADGVSVAGVDIGGMRAGQARAVLEQDLAEPLGRPLEVEVGKRSFTLTAEQAQIRIDVETMVQEALRESRSGNVLSRTVRYVAGDDVDADIEPRYTWSRPAVAALVRRIKRRADRDPQDAAVKPTPDGLEAVDGRHGLAVRGKELERRINEELARPHGQRVVTARMKTVEPDVTKEELASSYPAYVIVDRSRFRLRFFRNLEHVKTYTIAVGKAGLETPAGLYHIQNKAVDPAWHVPQSDWAGDLAGKVIPPGPENPIKARWMGIYDGAGIHGTDAVGSLGTAASHGCIRMSIPEVKELFEKVPVQTPVYIF